MIKKILLLQILLLVGFTSPDNDFLSDYGNSSELSEFDCDFASDYANNPAFKAAVDEDPDLAGEWAEYTDLPASKGWVRTSPTILRKSKTLTEAQKKGLKEVYRTMKLPSTRPGPPPFSLTKDVEGVGSVKIDYDEFGFPNFESHTPGPEFTYKSENLLGNDSSPDFTAATNWLKGQFPDKNIRKVGTRVEIDGKEYTWHHHEDGKSIMPVDPDVHSAFRHSGGSSTIEKGVKGVFDSPY